MIVSATMSLADIVRAIEEAGGKIEWGDKVPPTTIAAEADVDDEEAFQALPSHWITDLLEEQEGDDPADERNVGAFVDAMARRDQPLALAMSSRVFVSDRWRLAAERALRGAVQ